MPERQVLSESRPLVEADSSGLATIQLIDPGWGSTGYYATGVLSEAATARVFPAGTHMYLDHPAGDGSGVDKDGNRSIRDLAAVLVEDARTDNSGGLVAAARVFEAWRPVLAEVKDDIGVSIRARGTGELGEAEGRKGLIITSLDEALSVDFVVAAGRGGRILELAESARALVEATVNDTREALSTAVTEKYGGEHTWCWIRDFDTDASLVYYEISADGDGSGTYQQSYTLAEDGTASLGEDQVEVNVRTEYVVVTTTTESAPAGGTPPTDPAPGTPPVADAPPDTPIQEDHMTDTPGGGAAPPTSPRQVMEARDQKQQARIAELEARDRARTVITESLTEAWLAPSTIARLSRELLVNLPIVNDTLDESALRDRIVTARDIAETEMAEALTAAGVGTPRGLGESATPGVGVDPDAYEQELTQVFANLGMNESAAKTAARGR